MQKFNFNTQYVYLLYIYICLQEQLINIILMKYNLTINIFPTKHNPVYKVELNIEKKQNIRFLKNSKINLKNKKGIK